MHTLPSSQQQPVLGLGNVMYLLWIVDVQELPYLTFLQHSCCADEGGVLCVLMSFGGFALFFHRSRAFNEAKGIIMSFIRSRLKK